MDTKKMLEELAFNIHGKLEEIKGVGFVIKVRNKNEEKAFSYSPDGDFLNVSKYSLDFAKRSELSLANKI